MWDNKYWFRKLWVLFTKCSNRVGTKRRRGTYSQIGLNRTFLANESSIWWAYFYEPYCPYKYFQHPQKPTFSSIEKYTSVFCSKKRRIIAFGYKTHRNWRSLYWAIPVNWIPIQFFRYCLFLQRSIFSSYNTIHNRQLEQLVTAEWIQWWIFHVGDAWIWKIR